MDCPLGAVRTDERFHFGRANCRAAIFMYKRDPTIADVWPIVETVFKAGIGYDSKELIDSVRGQVGIR